MRRHTYTDGFAVTACTTFFNDSFVQSACFDIFIRQPVQTVCNDIFTRQLCSDVFYMTDYDRHSIFDIIAVHGLMLKISAGAKTCGYFCLFAKMCAVSCENRFILFKVNFSKEILQ